MISLYQPLQSLQAGHWFKLICGASFQHLPSVRSLALAYTLAGADCVDVAADPAVLTAARLGIAAAQQLLKTQADFPAPVTAAAPWLMVSLNDGEDPHFRKATFDPATCPSDCPRPCVGICPAEAIAFPSLALPHTTVKTRGQSSLDGVIESRCYGCGRCLPICPIQTITTRSHVHNPSQILPQLMTLGVDAIELHTQVGHYELFQSLWQQVRPWVPSLKLLAISCPDAEGVIVYLRSLYNLIFQDLCCPLLWQTDGRPMSGDIGAGTTHTTIKYAERLLEAGLPGYVQLAGGTNHYTVPKLESLRLLRRCPEALPATIAGVAYGSYSRVLLAPVLQQLEALPQPLESYPTLLGQAIALAASLVHPLKLHSSQWFELQAILQWLTRLANQGDASTCFLSS